MSDPETRLFIFMLAASVIGCNSYITGQKADLVHEIGIVGSGVSSAVRELIVMNGEGGDSSVVGTVNTGFEEVWLGMYNCITGLLLSGEEQPYIVYEPVFAITAGDFYVTPAA